MKSLKEKIQILYPEKADEVYKKLEKIIADFKKKNPAKAKDHSPLFTEKDIILICYADHVQEDGVKTFKTMHKFLHKHVKGFINKVHFLPFCPWTSDDGFSVVDYYKVNEPYGDWEDSRKVIISSKRPIQYSKD